MQHRISKLFYTVTHFAPGVFALSILLLLSTTTQAQRATTSSPYSRYGLGEMRGDLLPQLRAMGGISTGIRYLNGYGNINVANPASYSALGLTTIDVGLFGNITQLSNNNLSENSYNFSLSHINFGIPMGRPGGISFGIMPFSDVGFSYAISGAIDTTAIRTVYAGAGGTTKAYLGYGVQITKNFSVGVNASYIFGTLERINSVEFPDDVGALNVRIDSSQYVRGFNFDYGVQYFQPLGNNVNLTIGYTGTAGPSLRTNTSRVITRTPTSVEDDQENLPVDTISSEEGIKQDITMPMKHSVGFSIAKGSNWLIGGDFNYAKWSDYRVGNRNPQLTDSYGFAIGGQITPDVTSVNYFSVVDYRLGFKYDKSYINISDQDIKRMALTVGFGFPLPSLFGTSFYKVNFATEFGQMGTLSNNLVRERYINFNLGFTLNDRWFRRRYYD
ncbi:outer membrane protein transport protein [Parapedobacter soli]|uniref:outer membrane protein transport protein n=1 Tax=Parapedobacter soli TaxID=416955 RepID=UPI0021C6E222|nr:outer membrane protein transport protein [Parapedobacter soli]